MKLHGKVAIIVGGGSGLGKQTAYEFVKEGCCVMIADINEESCLNTINNIREDFPQYDNCISYYVCDISKQEQVKSLISYTESIYQKINIVFNNASIIMNKDKNVSEIDDYTFDRTYEVNVKGALYLSKNCIPILRKNNGGVIINIASFVSLLGSSISQIAYTSSQGAVLSMTRELAIAHAKENIRFIPLCPGHFKTSKMMNMINIPSEKQKKTHTSSNG